MLARYRRMIRPHLKHHVIAVDGGDIIKPKAKSMPLQQTLIDASKGRRVFGEGWPTIAVEAVGPGGFRAPLALHTYSTRDPKYKSEKFELRKVVTMVRPDVPDDCIWAFDQGYDDKKVFNMLDALHTRWVVRIGSQRLVEHSGGKWDYVHALGKKLGATHTYKLARFHGRTGRDWILKMSWTKVRLHHESRAGRRVAQPDIYYLVVVQGNWSKTPMFLLTSIDVSSADAAEVVAESYFWRWGAEEAFRFTKQCFNVEDLRVLRWRAIKRMLALTVLAYGFLAWFVHKAPDYTQKLLTRVSRGFGGIPRYWFYRLQEVFQRLLPTSYRRGRTPKMGKVVSDGYT